MLTLAMNALLLRALRRSIGSGHVFTSILQNVDESKGAADAAV